MYDVVVAGAGPAGATAAYYLARQGHKVALLDKQKFPREKACGGGLCVHIQDFDHITSNWNDYLESACRRGMVYGPNLDAVVDYHREEPFFYNIRRFVFDNRLVEYARQAGAEVLDGNGMARFEPYSGGVTITLRDKTELRSRVLIGAGGTYDLVAQHIRKAEGIPMWGDGDLATAMYAEVEVGSEFMERVYGPERISMAHVRYDKIPGYGWSFSKRTVINVGIGSDRATLRKHGVNPRDYFASYVKTLKKQGYYPQELEIPRPNGSNIPVGTGIKCSVGDRLLVVGDAGGFVSPLSGEGLYYALDSGRLAAEALEPLLVADTLDKAALMAYHKAWHSKWGWDLWWLKVAWRILMFMPNKLVRYASWDDRSRELFTGLFLGSLPATQNMPKIVYHILKDVFKYDVFQWHRLRRRPGEGAAAEGQGGSEDEGGSEGEDGGEGEGGGEAAKEQTTEEAAAHEPTEA